MSEGLVLNNALRYAGMLERNIIIFFYENNTPVWNKLRDDFLKPNIIGELKKDYLIVFLDNSVFNNVRWRYGVPSKNTLMIITPKGVEIDRINFGNESVNLANLLQYINSIEKHDRNYLNLKNLVIRYPDNHFFKFELAKKYFERGFFKNSELLLIDTLTINPGFIEGYTYLARLYRITKNFNEALSILNMAEGVIHNFDEKLTMEKIKVYVEMEEPEKALLLINNFKPEDTVLKFEAKAAEIYAYLLMGNKDKAFSLYEELKVEEPSSIYSKYVEFFFRESR